MIKEFTEGKTEQEKMQEQVDNKVADFKKDMKAISEKHNIGMLVGTYLVEEGVTGVDFFGLDHLSQLGMAKTIERRFM